MRLPLRTRTVLPVFAVVCGCFGEDSPPAGLTTTDWAQIRSIHERGRIAIRESGGGHHAYTPDQDWTARFDGRGFTVDPKGAGWKWGLELTAWGRDGRKVAVQGAAPVEANGSRLSYRWADGVEEWFLNCRNGLEHGYTLASRPAGDGSLRFELGVRGGLAARIDADGRGAGFGDASGRSRIRYAGLVAWDADGRRLPARLEQTERGGIAIAVDDGGARYPVTVDPFVQQAYLKAFNAGPIDDFGFAVAASGETVVVGAPFEDSAATGVNGDGTGDGSFDSGAAYVFVRSGGSWSQQAYLKASNPNPDDRFGSAVAISGDTIVVGAPKEDSVVVGVNGNQFDNNAQQAGAAYVFVRAGSAWAQQAYLKASNTESGDEFGRAVAISGDTAVIGATGEDSEATGVGGNGSANGAQLAGAAYVFTRLGTFWSQQAYLKASNTNAFDQFGWSVAISGDTAIVGAPGESSVATGANGNQLDNNSFASGAAYVFTRTGLTWSQQAYLKASNTGASDQFGYAVAASGETVAVGAPGEDSNAIGVNGSGLNDLSADSGAAYVFLRSAGLWNQQAYVKASNTGTADRFGWSLGLALETLVVGAVGEDSNATGVNGSQASDTSPDSGAAYVFVRSGGIWVQTDYLKASNTQTADQFGHAAAVAGDIIVVGAFGEDSVANSVNGIQEDNNAPDAGAAYTFSTGSAATIVVSSGTPQTAPVNSQFASALTVVVRDGASNPIVGAVVTFTAPAAGASGTFPGTGTVATAVTNNAGFATSPLFTANGTAGTYNVVATTASAANSANFSLTNTAGCSYSVTPTQGTAAAAGATGAFTVNTGAGCFWNAVSDAAWLTISAGASGTGSGQVNYVVGANAGALRVGNITVAGQIFSLTQSAVGGGGGGGVPAAGAVSPSAGTGPSQTFIFSFSDPDSANDLDIVNVLINNAIDGRQACYLAYARASGALYLVNDAGEAGGPFAGTISIPGTGVASNSQCTINAGGSFATVSGSTLTLVLNISFSAQFGARRIVYVAARDLAGHSSGWHAKGVWTVPFTAGGTSVVSLSPARVESNSVVMTATFADVNGFQDLAVLNILVANAIDGRQACYLAYVRATETLFLVNDAGDAGGPFAGAMQIPGGSGTIANSQCAINSVASSVSGSGSNLTLTLNVFFGLGFTGDKIVYAAARDVASNNSGWQPVGTVTVP
ncbi:MAG: hypothetical protein R2729_20205 [Bryobacteraceae bacterium]